MIMNKKLIQTEDINVKLEQSRENIKKKLESGKPGPIAKAITDHYRLCGIVPEIIGK